MLDIGNLQNLRTSAIHLQDAISTALINAVAFAMPSLRSNSRRHSGTSCGILHKFSSVATESLVIVAHTSPWIPVPSSDELTFRKMSVALPLVTDVSFCFDWFPCDDHVSASPVYQFLD